MFFLPFWPILKCHTPATHPATLRLARASQFFPFKRGDRWSFYRWFFPARNLHWWGIFHGYHPIISIFPHLRWWFLAAQLVVVTGDCLAAPNLSALLTEADVKPWAVHNAMKGGVSLWLCQHSYGKWPFIVSFPMKHGDIFHSYVNVYQRVWEIYGKFMGHIIVNRVIVIINRVSIYWKSIYGKYVYMVNES